MKKFIIATLIIGGVVFASYTEHHYTRKDCKVVKVNNNVVTVEDISGNLWVFEDEGYSVNDTVNLKMFTGISKNDISDDTITKVIKVDY